jgi:hypothetical protein
MAEIEPRDSKFGRRKNRAFNYKSLLAKRKDHAIAPFFETEQLAIPLWGRLLWVDAGRGGIDFEV